MYDCGVCVIRDICDNVGDEDDACEHKFRLDFEEYYCVLRCGYRNGNHCGLQSSNCATDISQHKTPRRYQHRSVVVKLIKDVTNDWQKGNM